jgi:G:T/U-mismatch repair DNA glycosylase
MKKALDLSRYESDILAHDLDVIFCGMNPATTAAAAGHNFSSRSNRFWKQCCTSPGSPMSAFSRATSGAC